MVHVQRSGSIACLVVCCVAYECGMSSTMLKTQPGSSSNMSLLDNDIRNVHVLQKRRGMGETQRPSRPGHRIFCWTGPHACVVDCLDLRGVSAQVAACDLYVLVFDDVGELQVLVWGARMGRRWMMTLTL